MIRLTSFPWRLLSPAILLLALGVHSSLRAQTWDRTVLWERTFVDSLNPCGNAEVALDARGHIHATSQTLNRQYANAGDRVVYVQLLPTGDSLQQVEYGEAGFIYHAAAVRVKGRASPALAMMRFRQQDDSGASFLLIHLDLAGTPVDTVLTPTPESFAPAYPLTSALLEDGFVIPTFDGFIAGGSVPMTLRRFDTLGQPMWTCGSSNVEAICSGTERGFYLASYTSDEAGMFTTTGLTRLDSVGDRMWGHTVSNGVGTGGLPQLLVGAKDGGVVTVVHELEGGFGGRVLPIMMRVASDSAIRWLARSITWPAAI